MKANLIRMNKTKIFIICSSLVFFVIMLFNRLEINNASFNEQINLWDFQSIDTMKYSRDSARDPSIVTKIPVIVKDIADLKATYIAIGTPYDDEFYPVLKDWVDEARKYNLHVWFRGNFSSWEGWFNYPQFKNPNDIHPLIRDFIKKHPELFQEGDIFTPVPEPENGVIGDPRSSDQKAVEFNQFLIDSYNNCVLSFAAINKNVHCGYFSMNGDVAKMVLTKDTVEKIGNVVVIDHYVDDPEKMGQTIEFLYNKFGAKVVIGEFGAPIPDINGDMTELQQASFVDQLLQQIYAKGNIIEGINYWVIGGGSTALVNQDNSPRMVTQVIKKYFAPNVWRGKITNTAGDTIFDANVKTDNSNDRISFANNGEYSLATPKDSLTLIINLNGYGPKVEKIVFDKNKEVSQTIVLEPLNPDIWYSLKVLLRKIFQYKN